MKNWLITGANRGLGLAFAEVALQRGDRVAAISRKIDGLDDLVARFADQVVPLTLDVTDRAACFAVVEQARTALGQIDVVVNNAGYGLFGMVEELTEAQMRGQMEVNFFGLFHMTQAILPVLRAQGAGHILQISTVGGVMTFPGLGGYHASKWAVEGLSDALAQEVDGLGIRSHWRNPDLMQPTGAELLPRMLPPSPIMLHCVPPWPSNNPRCRQRCMVIRLRSALPSSSWSTVMPRRSVFSLGQCQR